VGAGRRQPDRGTDPFEVPAYPAGTQPDVNYGPGRHVRRRPARLGRRRDRVRGGPLDGKLLVVRYSAGQDIETFDVAANGTLQQPDHRHHRLSGFSQPLDLTEHVPTGNLYVTELGARRITLLKPRPAKSPRSWSCGCTTGGERYKGNHNSKIAGGWGRRRTMGA
jgi:hypothetical protein